MDTTAAFALEPSDEPDVTVLHLVGTDPEQLFVSPATVKTHISRLLMKLAARDRAQLVVIAYETGLVSARERPA